MRMNRPDLHGSILLLALVVILPACGHHAADHDPHDSEPAHAEAAQSTETELRLDRGRKWPLDESTRLHLALMTERIEGLDPATADTETLRRMGEGLSDELDGLIRGCTMTGEAHQQLHLYLTALVPAVDDLAAGDAEAGRRVAELLREAPTYFE